MNKQMFSGAQILLKSLVAEGIEETVTVFINATQYGGILKDKNNDNMVFSPVELNGKDVYTLDSKNRCVGKMDTFDGLLHFI